MENNPYIVDDKTIINLCGSKNVDIFNMHIRYEKILIDHLKSQILLRWLNECNS